MPITECTLCGKNVDRIFLTEVEGSKIEVCESCGKFGNVIEEIVSKEKDMEKNFTKKVVIPEFKDPEEVLKPNFGQLIMKARQKMGLERKNFAMKINEKESIIKRIESQEMVPDEKLQKKIENFLEIKLAESYEEKKLNEKLDKLTLTLGDVVEIK